MELNGKLLIAMNQLQINTIAMDKQNETIKTLMSEKIQLQDKLDKVKAYILQHSAISKVRIYNLASPKSLFTGDIDEVLSIIDKEGDTNE